MNADSCKNACMYICMMDEYDHVPWSWHGRGNLLMAQQGRMFYEKSKISAPRFEPSKITTCGDLANYWSYVQEPLHACV